MSRYPFGKYQDCSAWQRQRLSGGQQELQDYWVEQLRDLEPLELPTDRARPAMPSHHGENVGFTIEPALLEPFEKLCRKESATLQMGLLAVVACCSIATAARTTSRSAFPSGAATIRISRG